MSGVEITLQKDNEALLDGFVQNLRQVQERFIKEWSSKKVEACVQRKMSSRQEMDKRMAEVAELRSGLQKFRGQVQKNELAEGECSVMADLQCAMQNINLETDGALLEKEKMEGALKSLESDIEKQKQALEEKEKFSKQKVLELQKTISWSKERLGLQIIKMPMNKLQFSFTMIDQKEPSLPFNFCVTIVNRQYEECDPPVENLDQLVKKLNETNSFQSFILMMRRKFKELCRRTHMN